MDTYVILKDLAIIIVFAKLFGILARKCKAPQVVGELIAGIVLGPSVLGLVQQSDFLAQMAEIGVILLMFSAGLGTSLKDLLRTGVKSLLIACAGVFVPLVLGAILYMSFYGFSAVGTEEFYHAVFIGVILTATSVSITVQALKELGKLKTERYSSFESRITTMLEDVRKLKSLIDELEQPLEVFDEKLFHEVVTDICINNRDEMTVTLLGGLKFTEQI